MRSGGNFTVSGRGGVKRSSHQIAGKASKAARARGVAKVKAESQVMMEHLRVARATSSPACEASSHLSQRFAAGPFLLRRAGEDKLRRVRECLSFPPSQVFAADEAVQ